MQAYVDAEVRYGGYEVAEMCAILPCGLMLICLSMHPSLQVGRTLAHRPQSDAPGYYRCMFTSLCAERLLVQPHHAGMPQVSMLYA